MCVTSVIIKMKSYQDINNFLEDLEEDLCPSFLVCGNVDQTFLSAKPPDLTQIWRLLNIQRVLILDLKDSIESRDQKTDRLKKKETKPEDKSVAPKRKKPRKMRDVASSDDV